MIQRINSVRKIMCLLRKLRPSERSGRDTTEQSSMLLAADRHAANPPQITKTIQLGTAWAGSSVNTTIFRHHGILTIRDFQFTAFYADESCIRIVKRDLNNGNIEMHDLAGRFNLKDAHNSISMGHDKDDRLHITYDHHGTKLKYRRSLTAMSINEWTSEMPMTGTHEDKVTYPTFINPRGDHPLTLLYRDGAWNKGSARLKTFDEKTGSWQDRPGPILSGEDERPWTCNAYWNHPAIGRDGTIHLSYVWRTHSIGANERINNINICYARSVDNGISWVTSLGQPYCLPITPVNTETVHAVSPGNNLMNQCSMALDSKGAPHIAFYSNDARQIPQYFHLWFDANAWHARQLTHRSEPFELQGAGTLRLPISRPEIVIDDFDTAHFIYRGDLTEDRMVLHSVPKPYSSEQVATIINLSEEDVGFSEPVIDRTYWMNSSTLTIYLQRTQQGKGDMSAESSYSEAVLVDVVFDQKNLSIQSSAK